MLSSRVILFGPFEADLSSGELRREGHRIRLQAQPFDLLVMLLERPGKVVSRAEIRDKLWPADTFVDFDHSLGTAISKIRAALNDSAEAPRFVETLPKRGYRFIGETLSPPSPVSNSSSEEAPAPSSTPTQIEVMPRPQEWLKPVRSHRLLALSIISLALLASGVFAWRHNSLRASASLPVRSLAVLPLENLSSNPEEEFFANGMTDELITNLAKISSLRVISRSSVLRYRGVRKPVSEIARELGVDAIVEGTILRSGGKVRITAQLVQASTDRHLWAEEYERDTQDVLSLQGEVARGIAQSVHVRLTPGEQLQLSRLPTFDPAAEDLYWKGLYFINKTTAPDYKRAQEYFEQMLKKDPSSPRAWTGVAMAAHHLGMWGVYDAFAPAKAAALKAVALDDSLPEAQAELGMLCFVYDWNIVEAERHLRRAIDLNPNYVRTHIYYALMLSHIGRSQEAIEEMERARRLDPLSPFTVGIAGNVYFAVRRYDDAIRALQFTLEIDPNYRMAHARMAWSWEMKGEYQKAIEELGASIAQQGRDSLGGEKNFHRLQNAYAARGVPGYLRESLSMLLEGHKPGDHYGTDAIAALYARLGEPDKALDWLEQGYAVHDPFVFFWIAVHPAYDSLRPMPRFQKLLRSLNLPLQS
jgi:TolB-like protein/DNA-binding winged helix-turn-helix (wHTH) protein/tetratricopeptide (TPR) repeat protein